MAGLKSGLFRLGLSALWYSGVARAAERFTRGAGTILMLHRVLPEEVHRPFAPNRDLSVTPRYLDALIAQFRRDRIDILSLDEAIRRLVAPTSGRPFVCFTADDGYRDNYEHAFPIFVRHGAPLTIYVTTGLIDRTMPMWWHVLEVALAKRDRLAFRLGDQDVAFDAADDEAKARAFDAIAPAFFRRTIPEVRRLVDSIAEAASIDPIGVCDGALCTWAMLGEMMRSGCVELGCHTVNHPVLAIESVDDARAEIVGARDRIAAEFGRVPRHFAYPYGKPEQAGPREFALVRDAGFATAVTTRKANLFAAHRDHLAALPRVEVSPNFSRSTRYLRAVLSGLPLLYWNGWRRLVVN